MLARNRLEFVLLYYAASRAGVTLVPLNTRLAAEEWAFILTDAAPRIVFVDPALVASLPDTPATTVVFDAGFDTWLHGADALSDPPQDEHRDLLQLYTSATTGRPKGAVLTQRAVCANIAQVGEAIQTPPGERSLVVAPLFTPAWSRAPSRHWRAGAASTSSPNFAQPRWWMRSSAKASAIRCWSSHAPGVSLRRRALAFTRIWYVAADLLRQLADCRKHAAGRHRSVQLQVHPVIWHDRSHPIREFSDARRSPART